MSQEKLKTTASSTGFSVRKCGMQARTGSDYGAGTHGTGSQYKARGVMGRRKIEKASLFLFSLSFPMPPLFVLYFTRVTGDETVETRLMQNFGGKQNVLWDGSGKFKSNNHVLTL